MTEDFDVEALLDAPYQPKQQQQPQTPVPHPTPSTATPTTDPALKPTRNRDSTERRECERSTSRSHRRSPRSRSRSHSRRRSHRTSSRDYSYRSSRSERDYDGRRGSRGDSSRDRHRARSRRDERSRDRRSQSPRGEERQSEREKENHEIQRGPRSPSPVVDEEERDRRTVFVMQISARCRTRELAEFFMSAGKVRDARIIADRNSRRSKGVGYVEFYSVDSVQKALELSGQKLHGIPLIVQVTEAEKNRVAEQASLEGKSAARTASTAAHRLYVGSINFELTDEDLRQVFEPFGTLDFIQLQRDETGRSKGYAFIQFKDAADAQLASTRMNGFELAGRTIKVSPVISGQNQPVMGAPGHGMVSVAGALGYNPSTGSNMFGKTGRTDMDESDARGIALTSQARAELMQKLAREPAAMPHTASPTELMPVRPPPSIHPVVPTPCILLKNMFNPDEETEENWEKDIEEDVKSECSKYGHVQHIYVEKDSKGEIYVQFGDVTSAQSAVTALDGRWFAGSQVSAVYIPTLIYHSRFPKAAAHHGRV